MIQTEQTLFEIGKRPIRFLLLALIILGSVGVAIDTFHYFGKHMLLFYLNLGLVVLLGFCLLAIFKSFISLSQVTVLFVYGTISNIIFTNIYMTVIKAEDWDLNFFRDNPTFFIFAILLSLAANHKYLVVFITVTIIYLCTISLISDSGYVLDNTVIVCIIFIGFTMVVHWLVSIYSKFMSENLRLRDEIKQKEVQMDKQKVIHRLEMEHLREDLNPKDKILDLNERVFETIERLKKN
jgi:ABC-type multidrug transport system fused ATPase/permease subunit